MIRKAEFAGQFYESSFTALNRQIEECFQKGPGVIPSNKRKRFMLGVIAPHAGYVYSGQTAAWAYNEIGESNFPELYVILGTNHTSGETLVNIEDWETPFGMVKNANIPLGLKQSPMDEEHSVEVQLPFLQFVNRDKLKDIRILPIITNKYEPELCRKIAELPQSKIIICSSDFTHYGHNYSYTPFMFSKRENIEKMDKGAIGRILKFDSEDFIAYSKDKTICGSGAIADTIKICSLMGSKEARLLQYATSGDITKDHDNSVGYASVLFS